MIRISFFCTIVLSVVIMTFVASCSNASKQDNEVKTSIDTTTTSVADECLQDSSVITVSNIKELQYKREGKWKMYVYSGKQPFNGIAWSEDGKTYKLTVDHGLLKTIEYFDSNGILYCKVDGEEKTFYDENGVAMTKFEAKKVNREKYLKWRDEVQKGLHDIIMSRLIE